MSQSSLRHPNRGLVRLGLVTGRVPAQLDAYPDPPLRLRSVQASNTAFEDIRAGQGDCTGIPPNPPFERGGQDCAPPASAARVAALTYQSSGAPLAGFNDGFVPGRMPAQVDAYPDPPLRLRSVQASNTPLVDIRAGQRDCTGIPPQPPFERGGQDCAPPASAARVAALTYQSSGVPLAGFNDGFVSGRIPAQMDPYSDPPLRLRSVQASNTAFEDVRVGQRDCTGIPPNPPFERRGHDRGGDECAPRSSAARVAALTYRSSGVPLAGFNDGFVPGRMSAQMDAYPDPQLRLRSVQASNTAFEDIRAGQRGCTGIPPNPPFERGGQDCAPPASAARVGALTYQSSGAPLAGFNDGRGPSKREGRPAGVVECVSKVRYTHRSRPSKRLAGRC